MLNDMAYGELDMSDLNDQPGFFEVKAELLERFERMLRADQSVDAASREDLIDALNRAIDAGRELSPENSDLAGALDDGLGGAQEALIQPEQRAAIDSAFQVPFDVLQSDSVKRALEFARIARVEGENAARQWLSRQSRSAEAAASYAVEPAFPGWASIGAAHKLGDR